MTATATTGGGTADDENRMDAGEDGTDEAPEATGSPASASRSPSSRL